MKTQYLIKNLYNGLYFAGFIKNEFLDLKRAIRYRSFAEAQTALPQIFEDKEIVAGQYGEEMVLSVEIVYCAK